MAFAVCTVPVCPMRKEAAHRSEMVSELLFGEVVEMLELGKTFSKIRTLFEGYEGWCQKSQLTIIGDDHIRETNPVLTADWVCEISCDGNTMHLPMGCALNLLPDGKGKIGIHNYLFKGKTIEPRSAVFSAELIRKLSFCYLNTPYLWGGRSVFGIDCSGFVQQVFYFFNKEIPRDAYQQAMEGEVVGFLQEVNTGDLAFFDNEEGVITHVGLLLDSENIIHSSGKVRIDKIDSMGIVNTETGERTHKLRIIKRYG